MCELSNITPTFSDLHQKLSRHLSETINITDLSREFGGLDTNLKRVHFALNLWERVNLNVFYEDRKSNEKAESLRTQGNNMFKVKKLKEAWEFYTESLKYGEGAALGLAFANRSAVLKEIGLNTECLRDITHALQNHYPEDLKPKLLNRQNLVKDSQKLVDLPEVPVIPNKNPLIQCASESIVIKNSPDFGRFVAAARPIKSGEILAVETPFASVLLNEPLNHCHDCLKVCYSLIPCSNCTQALFCSATCWENAQTYHKYECELLLTLNSLKFDKLKLLALRIAFLAIKTDVGTPSEVYCSSRYEEIHNLVANTQARSVADLFPRASAAAFLYRLVTTRTRFFETSTSEPDFFKEILLHHLQTAPCNFHEITELARDGGIFQPQEIAGGAFSFLSLLNHSCTPNVARFYYGRVVVLRAIKAIREDEQCFDNYGDHYALTKKETRLKHLKEQYYFNCSCTACVNGWGVYDELKSLEHEHCNPQVLEELSEGNITNIENFLVTAINKVGELQESEPCKEFCEQQEIMKQCFALFANKRDDF